MPGSLDPVIQALVTAVIGAAGARLRVKFYTDPGPHTVTDPPSAFTLAPLAVYDPDAAPPHWSLRQEMEGIQAVTAAADPVYPRYNPDVGPVTCNGYFITQAGVGNVLAVVGTHQFDVPLRLSADVPAVPVQPVLRLAVHPGADPGSGFVTSAGSAQVVLTSRERVRHLWTGLRRDRLVYLRDLLLSLGRQDGKEHDRAEADGRRAHPFNDASATDAAISTVLSRCQECLDATR